jgi:hypothetical protein
MHPTFSAILAQQHRDELAHQARETRLARSRRLTGRSQWGAARWWWPAIRPARA